MYGSVLSNVIDSFLSSSLRIATSSSVIRLGSSTSAFVTLENDELGLVDNKSSNEEPAFIPPPNVERADWTDIAGLAGGCCVIGEGGTTTGEAGTGGRDRGGFGEGGTGAATSNCCGIKGI